jgi:valyl-tRNA synthetase
MNVPPATKLGLRLKGASAAEGEWLERHNGLIQRMARLETAIVANEILKGSAQIVVGQGTAGLALEGVIDLAKERARIGKEIQKTEGEIEEQKEKRAEYEAARSKLAEALKRLD